MQSGPLVQQGGAPMQSGSPEQQGGAPMQSGSPGTQGGAPTQSGPLDPKRGAPIQSGPLDAQVGAPMQSGPPGAQGGAPMQSGPPDQQGGAPMQSGPPDQQFGAPMQSWPLGAPGGAPMQSGPPGCQDVLDHSTFSASYGNTFMQYLVDRLLPANGSCKGGCPLLRPLCNGTSCIRPSCADLVHAGMKCSGDKSERDERERKEQLTGVCSVGEAGVDALTLARSMCSVTCGCSRLPAGNSIGCLPTSIEKKAE